MSVYDHRDKPAYTSDKVNPNYAKNKYILKWWTIDHDDLIVRHIEQEQWMWYWGISDSIVDITLEHVIEIWKSEDPKCSEYAWYNVLMYFAMARADVLGLTKKIREPKWKICPLCENKFVEDSLPGPLFNRLGIDNLDYCSPCLSSIIFRYSGNPKLSKKETILFFQDLAMVLGKVPAQNYQEDLDFQNIDSDSCLDLLKVLQWQPTLQRVKELFGSWLKALIDAGILEDGTRRTSRGIQTLAQDGHVCLSLGEKTIDDYLFTHGIVHEREPKYPVGNYRADFLVNGVFIEYFGLKGNPEYDAKTKMKQGLCKKHGIPLISIYPSDLAALAKLEKKLARLINHEVIC